MATRYKTELVQIPMSFPDISEAEIIAVEQVLTSGSLSVGPQVEAFEHAVASYVGRDYGVGVNSGTSGLHLAVIGAGIRPGDLVLTSPFSFIASANCILYEGGVPLFVDVDPVTGNIDPKLVAEVIDDLYRGSAIIARRLPPLHREKRLSLPGQPIKAVMAVHTFGQPCDMDPIIELARKYKLAVIEDACESLGAEYKGRPAGSFGDVAVFGFYPNKQMTTGEGGMIVTDKEELARLFRSLRNQGRDVFDPWLHHSRLGYNYRLDEMGAALGLVQIERIEDLLAKREHVAEWYNERLGGLELLETPTVARSTTHMSWFVYLVRIKHPASRNVVMQRLAEAGIPSRPYFTPIHLQPFYRERFGFHDGMFPVAEFLGEVSLALPFSGVMTETQVDYVCSHLRKVLSKDI